MSNDDELGYIGRNYVSLPDQLRQAIRDSKLSQYRIALDTGISIPSLNRFLHGKRGINLQTASRICERLDIRLTKPKGRRKP